MGSDSSPEVLLDAVLEAAIKNAGKLKFVVFASNDEFLSTFSSKLLSFPSHSSYIDCCLVDTYVSGEEDPLTAVRTKKNSTLAQGILRLRNKQIDAFVTAGNTGALVAFATFYLPVICGFERPALLAMLPSKELSFSMIDAGGYMTPKPHQFLQYALAGAAYQRCSQGIEIPRVGLLNIGTESKKGTSEVKQAYKLLEAHAAIAHSRIAFVGNVEGRDVFEGKVDVLVTDGFTGNVLLKTSEGISSMIFTLLERMGLSHQEWSALRSHFNYEEYPGALLCGVDGVLIKCHGTATKKAMLNSILGAVRLVETGLLDQIKEEQIY